MTRLALTLAAVLSLTACRIDAGEASDPAPPVPTEAASAELPAPAADAPLLTVYKSPTCGCCSMWVRHMQEAGFRVESHDRTDMATVKDSLGVPSDLASCHTGVVQSADGSERYVLEGHVPAEQVRRLLADAPEARGLSVPGMPIGSPGMEQGDLRQPYDVLIIGPSGEAAVYEHVPGSSS